MRSFLILLMLSFCQFALPGQDYNVLEYGAVGDGRTLCTSQIQMAIDAAYENGGGRVVLPEGRFLSGSIVLKSDIELYLSFGATLLGVIDPDQYIRINREKALVMADGANNIRITGYGEIDGQGREVGLFLDSLFHIGILDSADYNLIERRPKYYTRPQLIELVDCRNVRIKNIRLKNAASWVQRYDTCDDLVIDSVVVESDAYWNNDGLDITDSRNVRVTNCFINSSDDGICLKSHYAGLGCDNIYIGNCTVRSSASAVKLGSRSKGGFRNVTIENIRVYDTFRSAIAIESVDGGVVENIDVRNIQASHVGNAIFIRLSRRHTEDTVGVLRNVTIENVYADIAFERPDYAYDMRGPALPFFHNPIPSSITGIPGYFVENVTLKNIRIQYPGRGNRGLAYLPLSRLDKIPEMDAHYPEFSMFGELPAWGLYVRHAEGIVLNDVEVSITDPDYRHAMIFDDVHNLTLKSIDVVGDIKTTHIILHKSTGVQGGDGAQEVIRE